MQAYLSLDLTCALYASSFVSADETLVFLCSSPSMLFAFAIFSVTCLSHLRFD